MPQYNVVLQVVKETTWSKIVSIKAENGKQATSIANKMVDSREIVVDTNAQPDPDSDESMTLLVYDSNDLVIHLREVI